MSEHIISAEPTTDVPECSRLKCQLPATIGQRGFCRKHYVDWRKHNPPVDAKLVAAHVRELRANGYGIRVISRLTGVGRRTIEELSNGTTKTTFGPTATALLALRLDGDRRPARLDPVGVTRRLQAIAALGYTDIQIAERLGVNQSNLYRYFHGKVTFVTSSTLANVESVYRDLEMRPAPTGWVADRARRRAASHGWLPPFAWDDGAIDDPAAVPDPSVVRAAAPTGALGDVFADQYLEFRDWIGLDDDAIAVRMGITLDALEMRKRRFLRADDQDVEVAS